MATITRTLSAEQLAARLLHLIDRAERGSLLAPEAVAARETVRVLAEVTTKASRTVGGLQARVQQLTAATSGQRAALEEVRDVLEAAGHRRAHGDDWPDVGPALRDLVAERDRLAAAGARVRALAERLIADADVWQANELSIGEDIIAALDDPAAPAEEPVMCVHCGREIENRGDPSMNGGRIRDHWVHVPGSHTICYLQDPSRSRATPPSPAEHPAAPAEEPQPCGNCEGIDPGTCLACRPTR